LNASRMLRVLAQPFRDRGWIGNLFAARLDVATGVVVMRTAMQCAACEAGTNRELAFK
jgi:hypothetical protein